MTTTDPFADRKYIKRRDDAKNHSWQFQFENDPIKESKNFSDSIYGSKEAAFAAAKAYRDDFFVLLPNWGLLILMAILMGLIYPLTLTFRPETRRE